MDGTHGDDRFRVMDDVIYYKDRIYLVPGSQVKEMIMQAAHDSPLARHQGFSWRGLKGDVLRHLQEFVVCQKIKVELSHPTGLCNISIIQEL